MTATYDSIATTTLGSAASEITFSSIPNTFTDLLLICSARATTGGVAYAGLRLNPSVDVTYSGTRLIGSGTSAISNRETNQNYLELRNNDDLGMSASFPTFMQIHIFNYTGATNKTILGSFSDDRNGSGGVSVLVGLCQNTSVISVVRLIMPGTTFAAGTTATLYGIKAE